MIAEAFAGGEIRLSVTDRVATVTLEREHARNALTRAMWDALPPLAARIDGDSAIRAVLVRGAGTRAFSGGADIAEFPEVFSTPETARGYNDAVRIGQSAFAAIGKPVIAVIFGACIGGGCGLALACDLRFAAEDARFGIPPARLGAAYSFADTRRLVDAVGPARAKDMLFSGRLLPAPEALAFGVADRVLPAGDLLGAAQSYAAELASLSSVSIGIAKATIEAIRAGHDAPTPELQARFDDAFAAADFREGYSAFLEKRRPVFD
jgi:enoyl-CoA hydratase/carnithine racemase